MGIYPYSFRYVLVDVQYTFIWIYYKQGTVYD